MGLSDGGRPSFFRAIVSPLFRVRTLVIFLFGQNVNIFILFLTLTGENLPIQQRGDGNDFL